MGRVGPGPVCRPYGLHRSNGHILTKGYRFGPVGGLSARYGRAGHPVSANGTRGVLTLEGKVEPKDMKLEHLYLDVGPERGGGKGHGTGGDIAVYDTHAFCSGGASSLPYLDDRIACAVLLMAMERLNTENDLYFVFTGTGGGGTPRSPHRRLRVAPDYGIAVDVKTDSDDIPSIKHACSSVAGKGPPSR